MRWNMPSSPQEDALWEMLLRRQGESFRTLKGLAFTYEIRGNELFVSRKNKSVTRSTVLMAYRRALEIQQAGGTVDGPKKLGTFGASYLYVLFLALGVLRPPEAQQTAFPMQ